MLLLQLVLFLLLAISMLMEQYGSSCSQGPFMAISHKYTTMGIFRALLYLLISTRTLAAASTASSDTCQPDIQRDDEVDYIIVGAGGSGIQMGLFLQKYNYSYTILEKAEVAGSFWTQFPRFRELISVNKWSREEKHALRYDWHSFLDAPINMMNVTTKYFPSGEEFHKYMSEVTRLANLRVEYGSEADHMASASDGSGRPCVVMADESQRCARRRVFVGTGLREKREPLLEAMGAVHYSEITRDMAFRKRVCIFGNGNAGFETAENLYDIADKVTIYGRKAVRIASVTKYVGDVRTKFLQVLENFHFKLRDTVDQADAYLHLSGLESVLEGRHLKQADRAIDASTIMNRDACEVSVIATGFDSNVPGCNLTTRFPVSNDWYESIDIPGVHYIGWLMHERDFRRNSGGFLAGYRYLIRNLVHHIREEDDHIVYPHRMLSKEEVVQHVKHRLDVSSDLIILQDGVVLRDVIIPSYEEPGLCRYYEGITYQFHEDAVDRDDVIYVYFMWGDTRRSQDVFENVNRYSDTKALRNLHIHPVVEVGGMIREMEEDIAVDWSGYFHTEAIDTTIRAALDGDLSLFTVKEVKPYERTAINMTDDVHRPHARGVGDGGMDFVPPKFVSAIVRSILSGYASDDLQALTDAARSWVPFMFD